jgi:hypothetical protein
MDWRSLRDCTCNAISTPYVVLGKVKCSLKFNANFGRLPNIFGGRA